MMLSLYQKLSSARTFNLLQLESGPGGGEFKHNHSNSSVSKSNRLSSKTTLNCWMMVERYLNLREEVGSPIPGCEISSLFDKKTCQVVNRVLCFGVWPVGLLSPKKKEKEKEKKSLTGYMLGYFAFS